MAIVKTAAREAKRAGLYNLTEASKITGESLNTLNNWFKSEKKNRLFYVVLAGCVSIKKEQKDASCSN